MRAIFVAVFIISQPVCFITQVEAKQQPNNQQPPAPGVPPPVIVQQNVYSGQIAGRAPKSRIAYILLGIFLGTLGIHNFYAGYSGRGAGQLLIALFLGWLIIPIFIIWIWVIIEIITVNTDAYGTPMS